LGFSKLIGNVVTFCMVRMPQLNIAVFYDSVLISFFFVLGFVLFLRIILPFLSFFSKYNNYLTFCLLSELSEEAYDYALHMHLFFFIKYGADCFTAVYSSYYTAVHKNLLFYGLTEKELYQVLSGSEDFGSL